MNTQNQQGCFVVDIQNNCPSDTARILPDRCLLEHWVCVVLQHEGLSEAELTLRLVDVAEMQTLNHQYRRKDYPTNVLSFPAEIPAEVALDLPFLGDIVLCAPIIQQEAVEQDKALMAHWAHMVVHGVLHLLGYDHVEDQEALVMEAKEILLLKGLNVANPYDEE